MGQGAEGPTLQTVTKHQAGHAKRMSTRTSCPSFSAAEDSSLGSEVFRPAVSQADVRSHLFGLGVHDEVIFATQVHSRFDLNRSGLNVAQPQVLSDCHEMNLHFGPGESCPDAVSRAYGKRDGRQPMPVS